MATTTENLNLRTGPGTSSPVILVIPKGATVTVGAAHGDWTPVSYNAKNGWVSSRYLALANQNDAERKAKLALLSYSAFPYIWGGQSRAGLDCSGLVGEWWEDIGFRPEGFDTTADTLYDAYREGKLPGTKLTTPRFGALAFYGSGANAGHVAICYDDLTVIGANGGAKSVNTVAKARAKGAGVRLDLVDYRDDRLGIYMPNYLWS